MDGERAKDLKVEDNVGYKGRKKGRERKCWSYQRCPVFESRDVKLAHRVE